MTHHHHSPTISRPLLLRILSSTALVLPPILYLISLSLTLATQYNPSYALASLANSSGLPSGAHISASPFYLCARPPTESIDDTSTFEWKCDRQPLIGAGAYQKCYERFLPGWDNVQLCQKVVASARLYVAGAVMVGLACVFVGVVGALRAEGAWAATETRPGYEYAAVHRGQNVHKGDGDEGEAVGTGTGPATYEPYSARSLSTAVLFGFATLLALLATACLIFAQILGVQGLVNEQRPTAGESPGDGIIGRWYMGTPALVWSTVAWLSALIGVFVAVAGRVGSR
ncbi:hypothetical protein EJ04DRAFT_510008 [Polyplosphaeria fusca]|uniref:Uncharacterized protein n=1 Tax=Polyplosphaeria fusca TaxID=682080 RepID=A0A9P4R306_9PLEO|nr:hypothetical protein EJ04DRAFT_510008 [Polyplosphaeria fusca]